jgi:tripartite-type tricarboxylate transporter receptor subunit TctC
MGQLHRPSTCFAGRDTADIDGLLPPSAGCGILALTNKNHTWEDTMRRWLGFIALPILTALASPAVAQDYPTRSIRAIASQGPGGLSDIWMRALADELGPALGTTVVVEDRVGGAGTIGARACGESPPDGYTICILPTEAMVINPVIHPTSGFDPKKSLAPITKTFYLTQVFAVNASLKVKSFPELIAHTKANPKTMNYMAPSLSKVAFMEELNKKEGTDFVRVPFKGGGDAVNSMLSGVTPVAAFGIGNLIQLIREGKIVGLAVDGDARSPLAPQIPTFKENGYTLEVWSSAYSLLAPAGTPKPIVEKVYQAVVKIGSNPEFQKRFIIPRGLTPVFNTPEQFAKIIEAEMKIGHDVVTGSGLYPDVK